MFLLTLLPSIVRDLLPARSWNQVEINPRERAVACTFVHRKNRLLQFDLYQLDWSQICSSSSSLTRHHSFFRKQPFTLLRMYDCFTWLCKSAVAKELFLNTGFVPLFGLKIQGLFKDIFSIFQGLQNLCWIILATNCKDFPALTAIFKALNFYFEIQGLSRHMRTL